MNPQDIYNQNNAQIAQFKGLGQQQQGVYNQNVAQSQNAMSDLSNYRKTMQNPSDMYSQNLSQAEGQFGFNPMALQQAQRALATTQTTMANLPQAVQQSANGRGLTGAQMANRLTSQAGNLQGVLAGQANQSNALTNVYNAAQQQANQKTGYGVQYEQMNLGALQNLYQDTLGQQQQASALLQHYNSMQQNGVALNVQEQQAQAAAAQAAAQAQMAAAQMQQAMTAKMVAQAELSGLNANGGRAAAANPAQFSQVQNYASQRPGFLQELEAYLQNQGQTFMQGPGGIANGANSILKLLGI